MSQDLNLKFLSAITLIVNAPFCYCLLCDAG
uniref:Uncharacterized protein n=1 Tax=Arundo donax TaxID=35708 RepID=A0A0A9CBA3_ARUDO